MNSKKKKKRKQRSRQCTVSVNTNLSAGHVFPGATLPYGKNPKSSRYTRTSARGINPVLRYGKSRGRRR